MLNFKEKPLFIFEMANNHMGDINHGLEIIKEIHKVCKGFDFNFAFKFQYRDLDTFIHPDYRNSEEFKYIKRFTSTRLSKEDFQKLINEARKSGFKLMCTPFDEASVKVIEEQKFDILKVASCSFTDWPLLERIVQNDMPLILSTAGASEIEIDQVVTFLENRKKNFCLMHCVGEYPTKIENSELNQISFLRLKYPNVVIGYSTHEDPNEVSAIKMAIAHQAKVFERHVGLETTQYQVNLYSSTPDQIKAWLLAAEEAFKMNGAYGKRRKISEKELTDLNGLKRGVFAKVDLNPGDKLTSENVFFAIPNVKDQLKANDFSKYIDFIVKKEIKANNPVFTNNLKQIDLRERVFAIMKEIKAILHDAKIHLPDKVQVELSHHYGLDKFEDCGATIINCINREYCKKLIVLLKGQKHPMHFHKKKEETFHVLYGDIEVKLADNKKQCVPGDMIVVERGLNHNFASQNGGIFEEISTTHFNGDSYYEDEKILANKSRKTEITVWANWLKNI
ncbi:MAG: N-acetylneuraminate synthase family protein [Candidatus Margulisiibacteriota bacterium]|jgi:sialic acid synthase SpsE/quercetin dioxygenase-like cupin family protein